MLKHWLLEVRSDKVQMPDKNFAERTVVSHPGAVAVVALDDASRVLMIRQYRHPVGYQLWEIPAGLRDAAGEPPLETARRELFEETGYRAREWHVLIDYFTSPGFSTERLRIYLARGVEPAKDDAGPAYVRHDEEKFLVQQVGSARRGGPPGAGGQPAQQRGHHRRPRRPGRPGSRLLRPPPRRRPRALTRPAMPPPRPRPPRARPPLRPGPAPPCSAARPAPCPPRCHPEPQPPQPRSRRPRRTAPPPPALPARRAEASRPSHPAQPTHRITGD